MDNTKIGKERGHSYCKNEKISRWKAHINTQKLNWNVLTIKILSQSEENNCMWTHGKNGALSLSCDHIHLLPSDRERNLWSSKRFS